MNQQIDNINVQDYLLRAFEQRDFESVIIGMRHGVSEKLASARFQSGQAFPWI